MRTGRFFTIDECEERFHINRGGNGFVFGLFREEKLDCFL